MKQWLKKNWPWLILGAVLIAVSVFLYFQGFRITYAPELESSWDAVSAVASWVSVFVSIAAVAVSGVAIWVAIQVPKKIATRQDKIALFEKRLEVYSLFEKQAHGREWKRDPIAEKIYSDFLSTYVSPYDEKLLYNDSVLKMLYPDLSERLDLLRKNHREIQEICFHISSALDYLIQENSSDYQRILELYMEQSQRDLSKQELDELHHKSQSVYENFDFENRNLEHISCNIYDMDTERNRVFEEMDSQAKEILKVMGEELRIPL